MSPFYRPNENRSVRSETVQTRCVIALGVGQVLVKLSSDVRFGDLEQRTTQQNVTFAGLTMVTICV